MGLVASYPDINQVKEVLETYLPERTKRYSRNIPDPQRRESWLWWVLVTGKLVRLQLTPLATPITVAVHASASAWRECFEKISTPEFSAARRALGIDKYWMLILEDIADVAPSSDELINFVIKLLLLVNVGLFGLGLESRTRSMVVGMLARPCVARHKSAHRLP